MHTDGVHRPGTLTQKLLAVSISLVVGLLLVFGLGEIVLRLRAPTVIRVQNDKIILPRNQTYIYTNKELRGCDPRIVQHKNSLGFRGAEPPADFKDALTIVAVGGSTTECFYLSDGHSWPEVLETRLKQEFPNVWVNNAGLDGHSTFGHLIMVRDVLTPLHPKIALFLIGINDVGRDDLLDYDKTLLKENASGAKKITVWLAERSRMIALLENVVRAFRAWEQGLNHRSLVLERQKTLIVSSQDVQALINKHRTTYIEPFRTRLNQLIQLCRDAGIQPVLITQPALYGAGKDPVTGVDLETIEVKKDENGTTAWQILEMYNDVTRSVAKETNSAFIDLAHQLPKSSEYFYDYYHFTNAGAVATANVVARELRTSLKYPQGTGPSLEGPAPRADGESGHLGHSFM
jgi:lysophospholipase L1-like esterase